MYPKLYNLASWIKKLKRYTNYYFQILKMLQSTTIKPMLSVPALIISSLKPKIHIPCYVCKAERKMHVFMFHNHYFYCSVFTAYSLQRRKWLSLKSRIFFFFKRCWKVIQNIESKQIAALLTPARKDWLKILRPLRLKNGIKSIFWLSKPSL